MNIKLFLASSIFSLSQLTYATYDMYADNIPKDAFPKKGYKEMMNRIDSEIKERKKQGYLEEESRKYEQLSTLEQRIKSQPLDTHLSKSISGLNIASTLKKVPETIKAKTLGYQVSGGFSKETGWNGVTEIFKSKASDICQFSHLDLQLSGGGYSLSEEDEQRDVNGKYTVVRVTGKKNQGFDYQIDWIDNLNWYTLTCINKEFSKNLTQRYIDLAKKIDSSW